jgi:hypothetical protein
VFYFSLQMSQLNCSALTVHEVFQSLLASTDPSRSSVASHQRPSASTSTATTPKPLTSTATAPLTSPPRKNSIRYIDNDQNNHREKYDGSRWRLACTWNIQECTNLAYTHQLCYKHNAVRRNKEIPKRKRKPLFVHLSLPISNI